MADSTLSGLPRPSTALTRGAALYVVPAGSPQQSLRGLGDDLIPVFNAGYITGLKMVWRDAGSIDVESGEIDINGKLYTFAGGTYHFQGSPISALNIAGTVELLQASAAFYVFAYNNGGTAEIRFENVDGAGDGAAPELDSTLHYYKAASTGAEARRIGKFWTDGSSNIVYFEMAVLGRLRKTLSGSGVRLLTNGTQTSFTPITITPYFTADDEAMVLLMRNNISTGTAVQVYTNLAVDGGTNLAKGFGCMLASSGEDHYDGIAEVPYTGTLHYRISSGANGRLILDAMGYAQLV